MSHTRNRIVSRTGGAIVEFAVVMPIIFMCFVCIVEFSRVLMLQHTVDSAAYEAARAAMVPGAKTSDAEEMGKHLLNANRLKEYTILVSPEEITEETAIISVTVQLPLAQNSWLPPFWFSGSTIRSEVSLLCERPPLVLLSGIPEMQKKLLGLGILGL